jgi:hypothetical protein
LVLEYEYFVPGANASGPAAAKATICFGVQA